jgi:hypothetical protein
MLMRPRFLILRILNSMFSDITMGHGIFLQALLSLLSFYTFIILDPEHLSFSLHAAHRLASQDSVAKPNEFQGRRLSVNTLCPLPPVIGLQRSSGPSQETQNDSRRVRIFDKRLLTGIKTHASKKDSSVSQQSKHKIQRRKSF